jgi:HEAT repeat protein
MALKKHRPLSPSQPEPRHGERDLPALLAQLRDDDPTRRRHGVRDLTAFPESAAALVRLFETEGDNAVRAALSHALVALGGETVVSGMVELLRSDDPWLRNAAIDVLKQLPDSVAPHMQRLLHDADSDVRIFAVNVLEALCHPMVEDWLIQVVATDPHVNVVSTALDLLSEVGSDRALAAIERLPHRFAEHPYIAFAVAIAQKRIASAE